MAQIKYKVGDIVFFSTGNYTVAGEGMFIGQLNNSPDDLVLVIGKQIAEVAAEHCMLTRGGFPAEGASWRRAYLKQKPGALV
jgi:hypothetical protein